MRLWISTEDWKVLSFLAEKRTMRLQVLSMVVSLDIPKSRSKIVVTSPLWIRASKFGIFRMPLSGKHICQQGSKWAVKDTFWLRECERRLTGSELHSLDTRRDPLLSPLSGPVPRVLTHSPQALCPESPSAQTPAANHRQPVPDPLAPKKKRGQHAIGRNDENSLPLFDTPSRVPGPPLKKRRASPKHAAAVQQFLRGKTKIIPSFIVNAWLRSADGRIAEGSEESSLMYSTKVDYKLIKSVCPALTSFVVQLVQSKLCSESSNALRQHDPLSTKPMGWLDIGQHTVAKATATIQKDQPVLWDLMLSLGLRQPRGTHRVMEQRRRCPVEGVCTHVISTINHVSAPRSPKGRLVPTLRGLYYFASSVPYDIFTFSSRKAAASM
ncbi:hypothetical protein BU15DRAFT_67627 [Melanogaster broomeanus]|nr:hypothetical protein BU15DRAFT_67627 [Melanogaster broomeanus]